MFEQFNRAAERAATCLSRRQAVGRIGQLALGAASIVAGISLTAQNALAGSNICSPESPNGCANQPVGSPCATSPGKCASEPKQHDAAGRLICNVCRIHGLPKD